MKNYKWAYLIPTYKGYGKLFSQMIGFIQYVYSRNIVEKPFLYLKDYEKDELFTVHGIPHICHARNFLVTNGHGFTDPHAFCREVEYFIFIDEDIQFTLTDIERLKAANSDFCCGCYSWPGSKEIISGGRWDLEEFKTTHRIPLIKEDEVKGKVEPIKVDFVAMGFTKIKADIFERIQYPFFFLKEQSIDGYRDLSYEDVSFCQKVFDATGIKPDLIPTIRLGHLKEVVG